MLSTSFYIYDNNTISRKNLVFFSFARSLLKNIDDENEYKMVEEYLEKINNKVGVNV